MAKLRLRRVRASSVFVAENGDAVAYISHLPGSNFSCFTSSYVDWDSEENTELILEANRTDKKFVVLPSKPFDGCPES